MAVLNPVTQSYLQHKISERQAHYDKVQTYRDYADGHQTLHLTDDQKILLVGETSSGSPASDPEFMLNICSIMLEVETDRLEIQGIKVNAPDNDALTDELSRLAWQWFTGSRMDEGQQNAHYAACRDADSFGFVYYDPLRKMPRVAINPSYDGAGSGADVFYTDDDPTQPEAAVKIWVIQETANRKITRKNIYYPDRIEKWINDSGISGMYQDAGWRPLRYGDVGWSDSLQEAPTRQTTALSTAATVEWWTDTGRQNGRPLGIPIHHFRHQARGGAYGRSTIADVVPGLQDAINRAGLDIQAAAILSGFKMITATGVDSTATSLKAYPGAILYSTEPDAAFGQIAESDLLQLVEVKNSFIRDGATLTNTPLSFFNLGGQAPAEGSQKQLEMGLLAKTRRNQTSFGNTWEDVIRYMFKLESVSKDGALRLSWEQIEALEIEIAWSPAEMRNELTDIQVADAWSRLKVPEKDIWRKLGFSEEDITRFDQENDIKRQQAMALMLKGLRENGTNGSGDQSTAGAGGGNGLQPVGTGGNPVGAPNGRSPAG